MFGISYEIRFILSVFLHTQVETFPTAEHDILTWRSVSSPLNSCTKCRDAIRDVPSFGAHISLEVGRKFQRLSPYQSQWRYCNYGLSNHFAFVISWKFSSEMLLICPKYSRSPEISNNFNQKNDFEVTMVKIFSCLSFAKARGIEEDTFLPFFTVHLSLKQLIMCYSTCNIQLYHSLRNWTCGTFCIYVHITSLLTKYL